MVSWTVLSEFFPRFNAARCAGVGLRESPFQRAVWEKCERHSSHLPKVKRCLVRGVSAWGLLSLFV